MNKFRQHFGLKKNYQVKQVGNKYHHTLSLTVGEKITEKYTSDSRDDIGVYEKIMPKVQHQYHDISERFKNIQKGNFVCPCDFTKECKKRRADIEIQKKKESEILASNSEFTDSKIKEIFTIE